MARLPHADNGRCEWCGAACAHRRLINGRRLCRSCAISRPTELEKLLTDALHQWNPSPVDLWPNEAIFEQLTTSALDGVADPTDLDVVD